MEESEKKQKLDDLKIEHSIVHDSLNADEFDFKGFSNINNS